MLRSISEPNRQELTGEKRKMYNEEIDYLYSSLHFIRVIKSGRMR
jgi:hypothetical protein